MAVPKPSHIAKTSQNHAYNHYNCMPTTDGHTQAHMYTPNIRTVGAAIRFQKNARAPDTIHRHGRHMCAGDECSTNTTHIQVHVRLMLHVLYPQPQCTTSTYMYTSLCNRFRCNSTMHSSMLKLPWYCIYMHEGGAPPHAYSRTKQAPTVQCTVPAHAPYTPHHTAPRRAWMYCIRCSATLIARPPASMAHACTLM